MILRPPDFTQGYLRSILHYDPDTGVWTRKLARHHKGYVGERAGCVNKSDGRRYIKVNNRRYSEARLAWFYMKGTWPKRRVDHADTDETNNRWGNLRLATVSENQANCGARKTVKGVTRVRTGKWTAQIQKHRRKQHLGTFATEEEAHAAYRTAAVQLYGQFARFA